MKLRKQPDEIDKSKVIIECEFTVEELEYIRDILGNTSTNYSKISHGELNSFLIKNYNSHYICPNTNYHYTIEDNYRGDE